jgi:hypothetical protein
MSLTSWFILIGVVIVVASALQRSRTRRKVATRDARLATRQTEIQSALDRAGAVLKDEQATTAAGEIAATQVLQELHSLNDDGSLDQLIADTELFIAEWRASKRPA